MMKIFTGADRARELGYSNYRDFILALTRRNGREWKGKFTTDNPLMAHIDFARWGATCECGNTFYVEPTDPKFGYCPDCGNIVLDGAARPIIFPENTGDIEKELLKRELVTSIREDKIDSQAMMMTALVKPKYAPRNWTPGQTIKQLKAEHFAAQKAEAKNG